MRNRFRGLCYFCSKVVLPGKGHFEKMPGGGWRVIHAECVFEQRRIKAEAIEKAPPPFGE